MIPSNALSVFILNHDLNGPYDKNIRLIKDLMRMSEPAGNKFNMYVNSLAKLLSQ